MSGALADIATTWQEWRWKLDSYWYEITQWQDTFPAWGAVLLAILAAALLAWAWWREAIRLALLGKAFWRVPRRCPACWYDLSGASTAGEAALTCPECGRTTRTERQRRKRRRRPIVASLALLLLACCIFQVGWRRWGNGRWILLKPTDWVIARAPTMDEWQTVPHPYWYHHVLIDHSLRGEFTPDQWRAAVENTGYATAQPREHADDPVTIDLVEVYWMNFFSVDVRAAEGADILASTGVTGYTPAGGASKTVVLQGGATITQPPPEPGEPVVLHLTIYWSNTTPRAGVAWEGTIEVDAPVAN